MIQISKPLHESIPVCVPGHRPQLVETRGSADHTRICIPHPSTWHIECVCCGSATVPHVSKAIAEMRWHARNEPQHAHGAVHTVPLHRLREARSRAVIAIAA